MISNPAGIIKSSHVSWADRLKRRFDLGRSMRRRRRTMYHHALQRRDWYDPSARSDQPAIFIGGCGRSGTTLFKELLSRHPSIFCGPETSMFGLPFNPENLIGIWDIDPYVLKSMIAKSKNLVGFAECFFNRYAQLEGKSRWADKTPNNVRAAARLLTWFPNGKFIHLIRDGRDVVCSLRHHPNERLSRGRIVPVKVNNPIDRCATRWLHDTSSGLAYRSHPRYCEVRYEDLVGDAEAELRRVCKFLDESFDEDMLNPTHCANASRTDLVNNRNAGDAISSRSVGRWQRDLSLAERRLFDDVAGELLIATGYVTDHQWCDNDRHDKIEPQVADGSTLVARSR